MALRAALFSMMQTDHQIRDLSHDLRSGQSSFLRDQPNDQVERRKSLLLPPKGLSYQSLDEISTNCPRRQTLGHHIAKTSATFTVGQILHIKKRRATLFSRTARKNALVLRRARQSVGGRKPAIRRQTAKRLRPLARRRAKTLRPSVVAMRARNPCVRARRTLEG